MAKRVIAQPLSKIPGNTHGSGPRQFPKGWDKIPPNERSSGQWVRAHLLNHQLHGPGVSWNLFPGTRRMNLNQMEREVEAPAKILLEQNKVLFYNVVLEYFNAGELSEFPSNVHMEFGEFDHHSGQRKSTIKSEVFSQEPPMVVHKVNINIDSLNRLKEVAVLNGVSGAGGILSKIVSKRSAGHYGNSTDIYERVRPLYINQIQFEQAFSLIETLIDDLKVIST